MFKRSTSGGFLSSRSHPPWELQSIQKFSSFIFLTWIFFCVFFKTIKFFCDWTFFKGFLSRVMASQRPRLVLALKNREKYLKTCTVAQNFSFFRNFQKKWEKKILVRNGHFWPFLSFPAKFWPFLGQFWDFPKSRQIIPQNEALGESFSEKLVWGSKKVNKGQKLRKKA